MKLGDHFSSVCLMDPLCPTKIPVPPESVLSHYAEILSFNMVWKETLFWNILLYQSYFSIAVIQYYDEGNLHKFLMGLHFVVV